MLTSVHAVCAFYPGALTVETHSDQQISRDMRFPTMWYVRPAKAQTSLRICED